MTISAAIRALLVLSCLVPAIRAEESAPPDQASAEAAPSAGEEAAGADTEDPAALKAAIEAKLGFQTGTIDIGDGLASLALTESYRYIGPESSKLVLEDLWGNPPGAADGVLGMLFPSDVGPADDGSWAVVVSYDEDGFVDDKDASHIDYADLLKDMKKGTKESNKERKKQGFPSVELVGWAEPPSYNAETKKMYWAKELAFEGEEAHTLNYNVRVLGRRGVLNLNAVSVMSQLPAIKASMQDVIGFVEFNEGHRYADYIPGKDKAAAYGVAGLVAGAVAAKAGLFKVLLAGLLAAKKLVIVAVVALGAFLKKVFTGKNAQPSA